MSTSVALHCPDCKAEIDSELRSCIRCGADVGLWPESQRTPLILPGNPAFSADIVRKRVSVPKIAFGTTVVAAVVGAVLYYMPERDVETLPPLASAVAADSAPDVARREPPAAPVAAVPTSADSMASVALRADSLAAFSSGDTALSRTIPGSAMLVAATPTPTPAASALPVTEVARRTEPVPTSPEPALTRPTPVRAPAARAMPAAAASSKTPMKPVVAPLLTLTPLVSSVLRPGERLQLRWTVTDRRSRRPVSGTRVEFTSADASVANVNPVTGLVVARAPGRARIIIDGGTAGQQTIELTVRAPVAIPVAPPAPSTEGEVTRSATTSPAPIPTPTPATTPSPPTPSVVREAPRADLPTSADVRTVVDRFIGEVRRDAIRNVDVTQFLADGADHRVTLSGGPNVVSNSGASVRVSFTMRFTKFDGGGRPVSRVSSVTMDVDKRDGLPTSSAVVIGALRRP